MENLSHLVNRIAASCLPAAFHNQSFFVNDIPADIPVSHNQEWVASVVSGMISTVARSVRNSCIRISANSYGHVTVLEIHDVSTSRIYSMNTALKQWQSLAQKIGGCLYLNLQRQNENTLSFSFTDLPLAA